MTGFRTFKSTAANLITSTGALALIAGLSLAMAPQAQAWDCLLDTNNDGDADSNVDTDAGASSGGFLTRLACGENANAGAIDSTALGRSASAAGQGSTALGSSANAGGLFSTALGVAASASASDATALGRLANASGTKATALGSSSSADGESTALGNNASAAGGRSASFGYNAIATEGRSTVVGSFAEAELIGTTSIGYAANNSITAGSRSTALGYFAKSGGTNAIAIGADGNFSALGASAAGDDSIVIGTDASDAGFAGAIVMGKDALATEAGQVILKSADTFTILGNGDMGLGTAAPMGSLDINSGVDDTTLLLTNSVAQWELKSKASTGRLNFKNLTAGGVPFKLGPNSVNGLLSVGTAAADLVEVRGELMVEGDVAVTGTLTTGGPTCGGGCDAVFGADYDLPSIEEHARAMYANSYLPQVGPTVPLEAINVSERMGTMLNELEKAHIYIAELNRLRIEEKQAFEGRLKRLEALLGQ